jgi:hypothetical protein
MERWVQNACSRRFFHAATPSFPVILLAAAASFVPAADFLLPVDSVAARLAMLLSGRGGACDVPHPHIIDLIT